MHKRVPSSSAYHFSSDDDDGLISDIQVPETERFIHHRSTLARSYTPAKACGLAPFFPWRMKHTLYGLKSPIGMACPVPNFMAVPDKHEMLRLKEGGGTVDFMLEYNLDRVYYR
uniref:Uncharacterized protein n=1 Tax=Nelumbo nucifera TaxID=4432 RepID=A0A822XPJ0_NELNU|nr:TPA_asm: hypothetical protein HUJ06_022299 [Nelumbo nucifera]